MGIQSSSIHFVVSYTILSFISRPFSFLFSFDLRGFLFPLHVVRSRFVLSFDQRGFPFPLQGVRFGWSWYNLPSNWSKVRMHEKRYACCHFICLFFQFIFSFLFYPSSVRKSILKDRLLTLFLYQEGWVGVVCSNIVDIEVTGWNYCVEWQSKCMVVLSVVFPKWYLLKQAVRWWSIFKAVVSS